MKLITSFEILENSNLFTISLLNSKSLFNMFSRILIIFLKLQHFLNIFLYKKTSKYIAHIRILNFKLSSETKNLVYFFLHRVFEA